ncbi:hypothetical protein [Pikeienuella sp. HZG-20]|uniref:hypothetical protein n=1 Tax=Paludibacillus litoralis TaxID=3133267 RepID=UPI0030EEA9EC
MTDKGIIFGAPMIQALLAGRKTQTRRVLKIRGHRIFTEFGRSGTDGYDWHFRDKALRWHDYRDADIRKRLTHAPGDRLWVREGHAIVGASDPGWVLYREAGYEAECARHGFDAPYPAEKSIRWRSPIHMPRWASRLTLTVTDVRVQRVQDISEEDALAEGVERLRYPERGDWGWPQERFRDLWDGLNAKRGFGWDVNPWVAALTFTVERRNIDGAAP